MRRNDELRRLCVLVDHRLHHFDLFVRTEVQPDVVALIGLRDQRVIGAETGHSLDTEQRQFLKIDGID